MERWLLTAACVTERRYSSLVAGVAVASASLWAHHTSHAEPDSARSQLATIRGKANRALADGEFAAAATLLQKANALVSRPDPELHYQLGEALWVLGRKADARAAYSIAKREIGAAPTDRLARLWLARIHDRFGDRDAACAIYNALASASPTDAEVALAHAAMHANARDWSGAEETLHRFLAVQPGHRRSLELLAWIREAQGDLRSELALREQLARDSTTPDPVRDYGRALERAGDWASALTMYRRARTLRGDAGDPALERALQRTSQRMAIEIGGSAIARTDVGASSIGAAVGVAVPFGRAHHIAVSTWRDFVSNDSRTGSTGEVSGAIALNGAATTGIAGVKLGVIDFTSRVDSMWSRTASKPAAFGSVRRTLFDRHVEVGIDGELNEVWRDAPLVELEGGTVDSVTGHVWANAVGHRLVIDTGAQLRGMQFMAEGMGDPSALQAHVWAGADWQLWGDASKQAAGEILDDDLLRPTFLASSVIASYRHHEVFASTNAAFTARLALPDHASVDEAALALRGALRDGQLAVELHGGLAYDRTRQLWIASGNAALWIATGGSSRLSLTFDLASEGDFALSGKRLSGGTTYHVDL